MTHMDIATMGPKDVREALAAKSKRAAEMFSGKSAAQFTADEAEEARRLNLELDELGARREALESLDAFQSKAAKMTAEMNVPAGGMLHPNGGKQAEPIDAPESLRKRITDSDGFKSLRSDGRGTVQFSLTPYESKTLITLSDGAPQATRLPRMEPLPLEHRTVADLFMQGTMDGNVLEYYEETTLTNAAVEIAEGAAKPEAALDWTLRTETASKIAVWIPATTEALADISWLMSTIQNRLLFMLQRREEAELLNGDGTAPNISGITDRSGLQTQAKGADPTPDAILKAANLIRVNAFYEPSAVVIHPLDMQDIRLLRTADGIYIFGSPSDPYTSLRLWGMEIRETTAQTQNTAIVGAFSTAAQLFRRSGPTITISTEHSTYFIDNKVAILAEQREALAVYRPNAFATVTGI